MCADCVLVCPCLLPVVSWCRLCCESLTDSFCVGYCFLFRQVSLLHRHINCVIVIQPVGWLQLCVHCTSPSFLRPAFDTIKSLLWRVIIWKMAGDHTSASSDSPIKFDVGVLSAGIMIVVRPPSERCTRYIHDYNTWLTDMKRGFCWILIVLQKSGTLSLWFDSLRNG